MLVDKAVTKAANALVKLDVREFVPDWLNAGVTKPGELKRKPASTMTVPVKSTIVVPLQRSSHGLVRIVQTKHDLRLGDDWRKNGQREQSAAE